jgi:tripartite-type tricarboxylate transporter receptor subunit TctC
MWFDLGMKSRRFVLTACTLMLGLAGAAAHAQSGWPSKPVRIVVPYPPGGANDILARVVAEKLSTAIGQPVLVENRPGAGAVVGTEYVVRAAPDGYTLLMAASGPIVFNPALVTKLSYNPLRDLAPVSIVGSFPLVLGVRDDFPARNLKELVQYTQANPNQSAYSHPTASFQLVMELLKARTGLKGIHVPYQGSAPSVNAVLTGEVQMTLIDTGPIAPMLQAGKIRALAVTSDQRLANYPSVPTLKEQGLDVSVNLWSGLLAPAGTPAPIIVKLQSEVSRIMSLPDVIERMTKLDIRPVGGSAADMAKTIATEIELWTGVARANQITAN